MATEEVHALLCCCARDRARVSRAPEREEDLRRALISLPGVRDARVEISGNDVTRLVVVAIPERTPSALLPPIRFAAAQRGLVLDPELIEILTVRSRDPAKGERRKLAQMSITRGEGDFHVRVSMTLHGDVLVGESQSQPSDELNGVAAAVVRSLSSATSRHLSVKSVDELAVGPDRLVVVTVADGEQLLIGSADVGDDPFTATARATLKAVNRVLALPQ